MNEEHIMAVLKEVLDPEYPISIVDLGLVKGVRVEGRKVTVQMTFTSTGCPCIDWIVEDTKKRLLQEPGIEQAAVEIVWNQPWTTKDLTDEGKRIMQKVLMSI
jgi:metal-sulfur cluster biosynthetic enzyme